MAGADKLMCAYAVLFLISTLVVWRVEPMIHRFWDGLWYCFAVATTVGFGDLAAATHAGRIVTVILSLYSIGIVAIMTAVLTSYFLDLAKARASESAKLFLDELEHLPELSREELQSLSVRVKSYSQKQK